ncbi:TetR/AcrR family transcriptional regulator [Erythrobacter sp.]|uniref:TetR/AcrR family transcriptional regulator n=1 Tax=Erythrobacter sp. TaxID=1042 RepID=UPI001425CD35|nr:TetR/AcrR family transcriptional regulator [Erythrobacter sp.]QIQ85826.1 MAG: TetR/AcrR family transcriptional regulator [Erythrobacter sp.]
MGGNRQKSARRRPSQARSKATVEAILEAATRILAEEGLARLNTNRLAEVAGVSVGSVYEYFADKRAVIDLLIDRHLSEGEAALAEAAAGLPAQAEPPEIARALVDAAIHLHRSDPRLHRVLSSEVPLDPAQRARVEALRAASVAAVAERLAGKVIEPSLKAALLVDTADALAHRWIVDDLGAPLDADRMAGEMSAMLRAYLAAEDVQESPRDRAAPGAVGPRHI